MATNLSMMQGSLRLGDNSPTHVPGVISPYRELGAYEHLWTLDGMTFARMADLFRKNPDALPSDLADPLKSHAAAKAVIERFRQAAVTRFGVRVHRAGEYPEKLRHARHPVELLYYQGFWPLVETPSVAIVGTRKPTDEGIKRVRTIATQLSKAGFTIVSGLATGIDTAAHRAAIEAGGPTIAVIGTPISEHYPKENRELQAFIAANFLLISQVPVLRYAMQGVQQNRLFFPERNVTMSALTAATIIVEAGETSGTLTQARAALHQGRKLFILESCFQNPQLSWPARFQEKGAIRVKDIEQLLKALG